MFQCLLYILRTNNNMAQSSNQMKSQNKLNPHTVYPLFLKYLKCAYFRVCYDLFKTYFVHHLALF